jgi:hypothetical protein
MASTLTADEKVALRKSMASRDNFCLFVTERWQMQAKPRKSEDWYLSRYHFANIDRQLDATTQWLIFNYYAPNVNNHNLWMAVVIARYFNKPATLNQLPVPEWMDHDAMVHYWKPKVAWLNEMGDHPMFFPFNNAVCKRYAGDTTGFQFRLLLNAMIANGNRFEDTISSGLSAESVSKVVELLPGIGQFLAGEIVQDLYYTKLSAGYKDKDTWILPSRAAKYGLSLLFNRDPAVAVPAPIAYQEIMGITEMLQKRVHGDITAWMTLRALGLYNQYYNVQLDWNGQRLYKSGQTINLAVPYTPEELEALDDSTD